MDGPFSFSEAPEEYIEFLRQKRLQLAGLIIGSAAVAVAAAAIVALLRGEPTEAVVAVQTVVLNNLIVVGALAAYGFAARK